MVTNRKGHADTVRILLCILLAAFAAKVCRGQSVNVISPTQKAVYGFNSQINWLAFRPHSTDLAVALYGAKDGGKVVVCKSWATKQNRDAIVDTMPSACFCVAFNGDGKQLAWCTWTPGKQIRIGGETGGVKAINCGNIDVTALAFDPSAGASLAAVATDGVVRIWNPGTGRLIRQLPSGGARGLCVTYSPDGRYLAAAYKNGHVRLWRAAALDRPALMLDAHAGQVNFLAFTPNSRWLASASADKSVMLWDSATGQRMHILEQQHLDPIACLAFSPDGKYLASGDKSGKVIFWSMETFRPVVGFFPHRQPVYGLAISSDGEWMATGSQDRSVKFFATRDLGYRMGRVRLLAVTEQIEVKVDGEPIPLGAKAVLALTPGTHRIQITTEDGSNSRIYAVDVTPDSERTVTVDVKSLYGKLNVVASRAADVLLSNGAATARGSANHTIERIAPGRYTVSITPKDSTYARETQSVEIRQARRPG